MQPISAITLSPIPPLPPIAAAAPPPVRPLAAPPMAADGVQLEQPASFLYRTPAAIQAYRASLNNSLPVSAYDPQGFLRQLGLPAPQSSGRTNDGMQRAFLATQLPGETPYQPDPEYVPANMRLLHKPMLGLLKLSPGAFQAVARGFDWYTFAPDNKIEKQQRKSGVKPPDISQVGDNGPRSAESPRQHYAGTDVARMLGPDKRLKSLSEHYERNFHQGTPPPGQTEPSQTYGTYAIARKLGFNHEQADRLGVEDYDVDEDKTRYGKTQSARGAEGDLSRHYNASAAGSEDSRITWARKHLDLAVGLARQGYYQRAEEELGVGMHSLQDMFAHGQITPTTHVILGGFPDEIGYNPQGMQEATAATAGYLREYLRRALA